MTTYLHIAQDAYALLVDIDRVVEVSDLAARQATDAAGLRAWRDRRLPVVDLGAHLGVAGSARQQVVLRDRAAGEPAWALDVEQVRGLVDVDEARLQPVAAISASLERLVDAACAGEAGHCLLRLRNPFAWSADAADTPAGNDAT